jgi:Aromatic-ring-opening dioxygenase LigAB, LigA subunit
MRPSSLPCQIRKTERSSRIYAKLLPTSADACERLNPIYDPAMRAQYLADAAGFADRFRLQPDQREALIKLDLPSIVKMGAHPLVPFLAQLQIERLRPRTSTDRSS